MAKCTHGPGYRSPEDAFKSGPREKILLVTCVQTDKSAPDFLATVDVDPESKSYGSVIGRTLMPNVGDELHHSGWNSCSSCFNDASQCRNRLILPCVNSNRIYVVTVDDPLKPENFQVIKTIEGESLLDLNVSAPHTSHCLASGNIMISCMGDRNGQGKGSLVLIDGKTFEPLCVWNKQSVPFGYDFWYQPKFDVLVSTEWGAPAAFRKGFNFEDINANRYGSCIHFWKYSTGDLIKTIDLKSTGKEALMPLEVRFLHNPNAVVGYVGCAFSSNVFRFELKDGDWQVEEVIAIPSKKVSGWKVGEYMPALITDILISLDDRFLYISAWAYGEVRQYNLDGPKPILTSTVRFSGLFSPIYNVGIVEDQESALAEDQICHEINGKPLRGGSQMLQLSLDGRRLYVTNSLFSGWDRQFFPDMHQNGSQLTKVNVDASGMKIDRDFVVDFGNEPNGASLAHEMRYPGGDCTSDIWI